MCRLSRSKCEVLNDSISAEIEKYIKHKTAKHELIPKNEIIKLYIAFSKKKKNSITCVGKSPDVLRYRWVCGAYDRNVEAPWQKYKMAKYYMQERKYSFSLKLLTEISGNVQLQLNKRWLEILQRICNVQVDFGTENTSFPAVTKMKLQYLEIGMMFDDLKLAGYDTLFQEHVIKMRFLVFSLIALILAVNNSPKDTWISRVNVKFF